MFFIEQFDLKDGVREDEFLEAWNALTNWWHTSCDTIKLVHFSKRAFGLGPRPIYLAIWETPNFASMDKWRELLAADPVGTKLEQTFSSMVTDIDAKAAYDLLNR